MTVILEAIISCALAFICVYICVINRYYYYS